MRNNRPSATAILILKSIVFSSFDSRLKYLVPDEVGKISRQFLQTRTLHEKGFVEISRRRWFRHTIWFIEHLLLPGIILHYILRKRCIEETVLNVLNKEEVSQVVILAAGFDSLACRLSPKFPKINFIEVDHPATQDIKREVLKEIGLDVPSVSYLSVDFFNEKLEDKLLSMKNFNSRPDTLFLAEGITMYLDEIQIEQLFGFISKSTSHRRKFIFTFMERQENGSIDFKYTNPTVNFWLNRKKEKFRWGISQEEIPDFLKDRRFSIEEIISYNTLRSKYLSGFMENEPLAEGECICIARTN